MRTIYVIGMGPGGREYLTTQAVSALQSIDVVFILEKEGTGKAALTDARRRILDAYRGPGAYRVVTAPSPPRAKAADDYLDVVADWHARKSEIFARLIDENVAEGESGGVLVWGDPALYDSSVSILHRLKDERLQFALRVIPGVTSLQALASQHAIPLHEIGGDLLVTTARRLLAGAGNAHESVAVMLDSNASFAKIDPTGLDIYWGAYLGTEDEILISGPLEEVANAIAETVRREKERRGWILDIYLLRRRRAKT